VFKLFPGLPLPRGKLHPVEKMDKADESGDFKPWPRAS